ncbi:unnamed protein product [Eretmochelys imbricata]
MGEQRAYEGLDKKALEVLCSEKGISFKKKATNQELRELLMASDQKAGAQPLPDTTEAAEAIRMQKAASKLHLEHEQKLADIPLLEKQKNAELEREATIREERARRECIELPAADERVRQMQQETHQMQQEMARPQLQVKKAIEEQLKLYPLGSPVYDNIGILYITLSSFLCLTSFAMARERGILTWWEIAVYPWKKAVCPRMQFLNVCLRSQK